MNNDLATGEGEAKPQGLLSALYTGKVKHRRRSPKKHVFNYHVFMVYLNLDELDAVLSRSFFWSEKWWGLSRYRREDFHGDPLIPLKQAVYKTITERCGEVFDGSVFMLSNWRYFGVNMNPLTTYYCFDSNDQLIFILGEVHNTPWNERHTYFFDCRAHAEVQSAVNRNTCDDDNGSNREKNSGKHNTITVDDTSMLEHKKVYRFGFDKTFSVSPFHPIDMQYDWSCTEPGKNLIIRIENSLEGKAIFDATLSLTREEISTDTLNRILIRYPLMTVKVVWAIYWQALLLFVKGVPFLGKDRLSSGEKRK